MAKRKPKRVDVAKLERPRSAPAHAVVEVTRSDEHCSQGTVGVGGRMVMRVTWEADGKIHWALPHDREGRPDGLECEYNDDGVLIWCQQWVHGQTHGPCMMLDTRGRPLAVSQFVEGRGFDVWMGGCNEGISEMRQLANGAPHGLTRWGDPSRPWEEEYFSAGRRHGIFRRWDDDVLEGGYPKFFVNDKRVSREEYELARQTDAELPAYREQDDSNARELPAAVVEALREAEALAPSFDLDAYLRAAERAIDWSDP
jgi:hypothetical protein